MKLVKSNKTQSYHGLMIALNDVISRNTEPSKVFIDYTIYQGDIALHIKKEGGGGDSPAVQIVTGRQAGELRAAYFSSASMINGTFDPFGLKKGTPEAGIAMEYHHKGFLPDEGFDYPKKMQELAAVIVHFLINSTLPDDVQMEEHFSTLAKTVVMYNEPKLK